MTELDLRMAYKKNTGNYANTTIVDDIELDSDISIAELVNPIEIEINVDMDKIPYVKWLEEKLIEEKSS